MTKLIDRVKAALATNPAILKDRRTEQGQTFEGFTYEQMERYGLTKQDLKKLERSGLAVSSHDLDATGFRRRWLLVGESSIQQVTQSWDM